MPGTGKGSPGGCLRASEGESVPASSQRRQGPLGWLRGCPDSFAPGGVAPRRVETKERHVLTPLGAWAGEGGRRRLPPSCGPETRRHGGGGGGGGAGGAELVESLSRRMRRQKPAPLACVGLRQRPERSLKGRTVAPPPRPPLGSPGERGPPSRELTPPAVSSEQGASVTGPQALFSCPSIFLLPLPAHKFNFQRPLCTSGAWRL